jgi:hypothetical protein
MADWRTLLLEASGPHRMINGTIATGALCRQAELVQWAHHHQLRCTPANLFIRLNHAVKTVGARRVVLDTIDTLFAGIPTGGLLSVPSCDGCSIGSRTAS